MSTKKIISGAILLGLSSLLSRLLGVYRDHLFGVMFGTEGIGVNDIGVYHTAFRIPDLLYTLLIYGAISSAFIPLFTEYVANKKEKEGWQFCQNVLNILLLLLIFIVLIVFIFAPFLIKPFALGFTGERYDLMISLTRIMLLSPIFFGISSIFQGIQNTFKNFIFYSIAPIIYNLSIICGALFFAKNYGVYALAFSVSVGAFLHMMVQLPQVIKLGFRYKFCLDFKAKDIKRFFHLIVPRIIGLSVDQLSLIINFSIATTLSYGATVVLPYAINLQSLPLGLFGIAFAIASFSTFAELASRKEFEEVAQTLKTSISHILFLVVPASVGLFIIRFDLIHFIFGGGEFRDSDVILTGNTLAFLLIGLSFQALIPLLARVFYSFQDTKTPVFIGFFAILVNLISVFIFTKILTMDVIGVAFAISLSSVFNALGLFIFVKRKLNLRNFLPLLNIFKILLASILMGIFLFFLYPFIKEVIVFHSENLNQIINLSFSIVFGIIIYFICGFICKIPEIFLLINKVKKMLNDKSF